MSALNHVWGVSPGADRVWAQVAGMAPSTAPESRLFMVLQAYIDESTDDDSGFFVLAGYVSSAEKWAAFSTEWEAMLPQGTLNKDGRYHFKMSEMAQSQERMNRVSGFHNIINRHVMMSIGCIINKYELTNAMSRVTIDAPWTVEIDFQEFTSPQYMSYRLLMDFFHENLVDNPEIIPLSGPIDFYFDDTSEKFQILRQWDEYISAKKEKYRDAYGCMPRFENDQLFLPLQAADFRAWWIRKWARDLGPTKIIEGKYDFPFVENKINCLYFVATEDKLTEYLLRVIREQLPNLSVRDNKPVESVDPPFPAERLATYFRHQIRKWWRK